MKSPLFAVIAATALALGASSAAQATTTNLGVLSTSAPTSFGGYVPAAGGFIDYVTFTLPANSGSAYSVANFTPVAGFSTVLTSLSLVSNPDGILFNSDDTLLASSSSPGGSSVELNFGSSPSGSYYLIVSGVANGSAGGLYTGAISISAVPEPSTYALMLAGVGAVGFLVFRRRG